MKTMRLSPRAEHGHALIMAIGVLSILLVIAGSTLSAVSARYKTALRTAAWEESLLAAESGVDMTIAQVAGLLPDVQLSNSGLGLGVSANPSLALITGLKLEPGGLNLANGVTVALTMDPLVHGGEGATTSSTTVSIDVLPLDQLLNGQLISSLTSLLSGNQTSSVNLLRIRSTGTVYLPGTSRTADVSKLDSKLMRLALVRDPATGKTVSRPYVQRQIQVMLKPVFPFEHGVSSDGILNAPNSGTLFDSFNSASALGSTNGLYDSKKRRSNIEVASNGANVTLGGTVYGNVLTDGANVLKDTHVTGTVNNSYFRALPAVSSPTWTATATSTTVNGSKTVYAGSLLAPAQYKFNSVTGTLRISPNLLGGLGGLLGGVPVVGSVVSAQADVFVSGDFTGTLIVDPGVKVRLYVQGNVTMGNNQLQNNSQRASELQILGVQPTDGTTRTISIDTTGNPIAAIYAPTHNVTLTGNGDFSGAIAAAQLQIPNNADVHFDEELALELGLIVGYELVSWQEIQTP
jgi:hypothetical protein